MFRHSLRSRASFLPRDDEGAELEVLGTGEGGGSGKRVKRTATTYSRRSTQPVSPKPANGGEPQSRAEDPSAENELEMGEKTSIQGFDEREMPPVEVTINFEYYFKWLEIIIWVTMTAGVIWALVIDFSKATSEYCEKKKDPGDPSSDHVYPFNVLPSLSRSMSSFRIGLAIWTIAMAVVFVARLLSTHFLHSMYQIWYADTTLNCWLLKFAYAVDVAEIVALLMIPAFSLDCDPEFHSYFFYAFVALTFVAELIQWGTRFLARAKDVVLDEAVRGYYNHIGLLVLLQGLFILFMAAANLVHRYVCVDYLYSVFAIGEYITVIINVRFKRDTIRFVK